MIEQNEGRGMTIRLARERKAWTQRQLGARVGVHLNTVWRWEWGGKIPLKHRRRLAELLDLDIAYLAHGESSAP